MCLVGLFKFKRAFQKLASKKLYFQFNLLSKNLIFSSKATRDCLVMT